MNADTGLTSGISVHTPFQKLSATRWLVRGKVMNNILMNWHELHGYFLTVEQALRYQPDVKCKAMLIKEMLGDNLNYLLLHFATPIVQEFEKINALFQSDKADPHELNQQLELHYKSLRSRLFTLDGKKKSLDDVDFGCKFLYECTNYKAKFSDGSERQKADEKVTFMKERCLKMLEVACEEVEMRLPSSKDIFKGLSLLSPSIVLNQMSRPNFSELPFPHLVDAGTETEAESQYRRIPFVDWSDIDAFKNTGIPSNSIEFWIGVMKTDGFQYLAAYALKCLIIPSSNAIIERIFSLVTSTKTKPRNKMGVVSLESIIRIKSHLQQREKCCKDFFASKEMINNHNSKTLYPPREEGQDGEKDGDDECLLSFL